MGLRERLATGLAVLVLAAACGAQPRGFVEMPAGTFKADPSSNVPFRGQPDPSGLRRGYAYDPVHGSWLPVPRDWVMPDFSSYVYVGTEYPRVSNMPALHTVKEPSGTIVSAGAIWIETDRGLWVDDSPAGPMRLVSNYSGYIAGGCLK